jgi:hypothetical protein
MLIKHSRSKKTVKIMDPDCAICSRPALEQCECEAKGLDIAVRQAEQRMMASVFTDIRYDSPLSSLIFPKFFQSDPRLIINFPGPGFVAMPKTISSPTLACSQLDAKTNTPDASKI